MNLSTIIKSISVLLIFMAGAWAMFDQPPVESDLEPTTSNAKTSHERDEETDLQNSNVMLDYSVQLCQGFDTHSGCDGSCGGTCNGNCGGNSVALNDGFGYGMSRNNEPARMMRGIDQDDSHRRREAHWRNGDAVPWESFSYGEYVGPHRSPHVSEYQLRVNDRLEFVYLLTREKSVEPYQFYVGDVIQIGSPTDASLNQTNIAILSDGSISLALIGQVRVAGKTVTDLQRDLNQRYKEYIKNPSIVVQVLRGETPLQDLRDAVDARAGQGGQSRQATVTPDGTLQLPMIGNVPAIGLTLNEIAREINARYRQKIRGIEVTPVLIQRAPRFIFVVGEVTQGGRFEMVGPTSALQAVALAGGFRAGGNTRQIIVFRRDENWRLTATKLDLAGALYGKSPQPADEIWLRDSDIVLIPKKPIQRLNEAVDLYLSRTLYGIFPQQGVAFNFDNFTAL